MSPHGEEPIWLIADVVLAIHDDLLTQHGGSPGLRDSGLSEFARARPRHRWSYGGTEDIFGSAAAYGFGIAKNHAFVDGNKRAAFQAMYTFLGLNGSELEADEVDVVRTMVAVADGSLSEAGLAEWLRTNSKRAGRRGRSASKRPR